MSETKKCAHDRCTCTVNDDKKYCSQSCEDSSGSETIGCDCPHAGCGGKL